MLAGSAKLLSSVEKERHDPFLRIIGRPLFPPLHRLWIQLSHVGTVGVAGGNVMLGHLRVKNALGRVYIALATAPPDRSVFAILPLRRTSEQPTRRW